MRLTILGSGSSHGSPVIGCTCETCTSDDPRNHRYRASALVEVDGRAFLIDTGPELRLQALRADVRRVDAVLYTHFHADHVHGIDDLKAFNAALGGPLPCYGNAQTNANLRERFAYAFIGTPWVGLIPHLTFEVVDDPFEILGVPITPITSTASTISRRSTPRLAARCPATAMRRRRLCCATASTTHSRGHPGSG